MGRRLDLFQILLEMIDFRSFSNLWYWIALAVVWSSASHWTLGIPHDMVGRASRQGGEAARDLELALGVQIRRFLMISDLSGHFLVWIMSFALTMLGFLGFGYGVEFAQAVFLLAFPLSGVGLVNLVAARKIFALNLSGEALHRQLNKTRFHIQLIGIVAIFVTALWGMYQNLTIGALG